MENNFKKRFKSSMKISKNNSIFDNLVPIEKSIRISQIHEEIVMPVKPSLSKVDLKKKILQQPKLQYPLSLPPIASPPTSDSLSRLAHNTRRLLLNNSATPTKGAKDSVDQSFSPINIHFKVGRSIKHMINGYEGLNNLSFSYSSSKKSRLGYNSVGHRIKRILV